MDRPDYYQGDGEKVVNKITGNGYELYNGDCLDVMNQLPPGSVDAIITDPPYGTTACSWDTVIPFDLMWGAIKRVLKPRGAVVLFGSQPFTGLLVASNANSFSHEWVWQKENGTNFFMVSRAPFKVHENILVFYGGATYNPQHESGEAYTRPSGSKKREYLNTDAANGIITTNSGFRWPKSIQKINTERGIHPTQKPVALMQYMVKTYTNPGDTVLDFTCGSGSTGVASVELGRPFIGIDNGICEKEGSEWYGRPWVELAHHRIANVAGEFMTTKAEKERGTIPMWDYLQMGGG